MNGIEKALISAVKWLEKQRIPYMVIGGMARSLYGMTRQTFDVDIKIILETEADSERFLRKLPKSWKPISGDPARFFKDMLVLPVNVGGGVVDFIWAMLPYEKDAVKRSRIICKDKMRIRVSTPEDLIIQKAVSTRQKDWADIEDLASRFGKEMDWQMIVGHARELSKHLDNSDILKKIEKLRNES